MRVIILFLLMTISYSSFCQKARLAGNISKTDTLFEFNYLYVDLDLGDSTVDRTMPDKTGYFEIKNINPGIYNLVFRRIGARDVRVDSLILSKDSAIVVNIDYPGACKFLYVKGQKPKCINGHTDHIIPIVYGLPGQKTMEKAKKGLVHLGGCIVSDCDPRFYCTIHKREL